MVYGCGNQMVKFMIFITNFLIFIFGATIFGISLWANLDHNFAENLSKFAKIISVDGSFYQASLWVLVAVGALLFLVGFLGCCGAICEKIFTLVFIFTNRGVLLTNLYKLLVESSKTQEGIKNLLPIEQALTCCGATIETTIKYQQYCTGSLIGAPDCYSVISKNLESMGELILAVGCILLVIQSFSMIFTCVLCRAFRERGPSYYA